MSYPPPVHLLRDLAFSSDRATGVSTNTLPVEAGLCDEHGVRLGVLATLVDVSGAGVALEAVAPDWIATADLQTHLVRPIAAGSVVVECRPIRVGARRLVIDAILTDGEGGFCGTGRMAFSRIPGSATKASAADVREPKPAGFTMDGGTPITDPLTERCGMQLVGPGQLRFDKSTYVENSFGTVNGGVLALSAEVAAVSACGGGQALDLHVHYLEQIGEGPVAVTAEVIRDSNSGKLCSVRIEDRADARLVAVADVLVAR